MKPRLEGLHEKKLIGKHLRMTLSVNLTGELWRSFMPLRKNIKNNIDSLLFSIQVYDQIPDPEKYDPDIPFEKWGAVEVSDYETIPEGMEAITLKAGLYAVFIHRGAAKTGPETFRYIFGTWLPGSGYELDNRPHFEILGAGYKNDDPDSEEEIWIPVKLKR